MADEVRLALRDASWFDYPSTSGVPQYHVIGADYMAACNSRMPLVETTEIPVAKAAPSHRCQRPACRNRWKATEEAT